MSYHTSGLIVRGADESGFLSALDLGDITDRELNWLAATSMSQDGMCAGTCGDWWVLIDQTFRIAYTGLAEPDSRPDRALQALSKTRSVVAYAAIGHSSVYGFASYENGRCTRRWLTSEGSLEFDEGTRLDVESPLFQEDPDEIQDQQIFELLDRFVPFKSLTHGNYRLISSSKSKK